MSTIAPELKPAISTPSSVYNQAVRLPGQSADDKRRIQKIKDERWKAFRGELERPMKGDDKNPDFNILDNRCGPIVLKGASFLFGQALDISVKMDAATETEDEGDLAPDDDDSEQDVQQTYLKSALGDMDDFMTLLSEGAINGGVTGMCFFKLVEPDPASGQKYPRIINLDPATVWVESDPDDCRVVQAFNIQYPAPGAGVNGQDLIKRQRIWRMSSAAMTGAGCGCCANCTGAGCGCCSMCGVSGDAPGDHWMICNYQQSGKQNSSDQWTQTGDMIVWPYRFAPIVYCQNLPQPNEFWGMADLTDDIIAMNKHINLVQSNIAKLLWFYSAPYIFIDQPELGNLKITPGMAIGLGQGVKVTAIHATGDIASARAFAADLRSDMDELSRVPAVALGRLVDLPRGNLSGVALALLFQPLLEKTNIKRRLYGRLIRDLCQRVLALGGHGDGESQPVELHWPEILPDDELQHLQALLIKQQLGWSQETIITEAGGDPREETLRKQREAEAEQKAFDQGKGSAPLSPQAQQMPPAMQQNMQQMPPEMKAQQAKLTGGSSQ